MMLEHDTTIDFVYLEAPAAKWTFEPPSVRKYVESNLEGKVLNLFAGKTKLHHSDEITRVDVNPDRDADYHFDATHLTDYFEEDSFDTVVLDPPYNVRKAREKYEGEFMGSFTYIKDKVTHVLKPGGKTLTFGYDSTGMAKKRGFQKEEICLINHKGDHNDTICVVESRFQTTL